ncbi:response regulator [Cupriavidus sp. CuC1]|uniref:ATP-binding response regulator n=1 Tax=Cupriavidus sp. CuC1 TaxID=3373131 RepID=UPI0037CCCD37
MNVLRESTRDMLERSRFAIRWGGILGLLCHPIYYVVWTYVLPQPYDNLPLRLSAAALCIPLILQDRWPKRYEEHLLVYWHFCLIYVLPFACTFLTIRNGFSTMWMMTEVMMIFILALCINTPLLVLVCIALGLLGATLAAVLTSPAGLVVSAVDQANLALLPVVTLCSMAFSHAISKGRIVVERNKALQSLAGSIAHEMRSPLGQLKLVLDGVENALPEVTDSTPAPVLSNENAATVHRHLAQGQLSIERGLRIVAMTMDEVSGKPIRSDQFGYLTASGAALKAVEEYGFGSDAERNRVKLIVRKDFTFKGDEAVFLFVLFNLIKNALYYFPLRPDATLSITVDQPSVLIRDTGPGVPADILPHLFEPFRTSGKSGGTGLGLAYCRRAMHAFGGDIACQSQAGQFTEFTLTFPAVSPAELADHEKATVQRAAVALRNARILLVDDDRDLRDSTRRVLSQVGAQVEEAENGQAALEKLRSVPYDLVLLDINMPVLDGYATADRMRATPGAVNRGAIIVAYTSEPPHMARLKLRKAGVEAVLSRSIGPLELLTALQGIVERGFEALHSGGADTLSAKTVLVADDDTYSRLVTKAHLERRGITVVEAEHGVEVLSRLGEHDGIDAIVLDIHMPGLSGIDTAKAIRGRSQACRDMPILALTGHVDESVVRACLAAGISDVLAKPVVAESLYFQLGRHWQRRAANGESSPANNLQASGIVVIEHNGPVAADLLDGRRLAELKALALLEESLVPCIDRIRTLVEQLRTDVSQENLDGAQQRLHNLLGVSGNIGASALHRFVRQVYPAVDQGRWPAEAAWLEQVGTLAAHSIDALQRVQASTTAQADSRPDGSGCQAVRQ